jgi:hypothetical protein
MRDQLTAHSKKNQVKVEENQDFLNLSLNLFFADR